MHLWNINFGGFESWDVLGPRGPLGLLELKLVGTLTTVPTVLGHVTSHLAADMLRQRMPWNIEMVAVRS